MSKKVKRIIILAVFISALFAITNNTRVYGFETNGGQPGECTGWSNDHSYMYTNGTCAPDGMGWIWFQYSGDYYKSGNAPDITFGPATRYMDDPVPGGECSKIGGFYHFGIFEYKEHVRTSTIRGMTFTNLTYDGYGSAGNWGIGYFQNDAIYFDKYTEKLSGNLNHIFYDSNGKEIARAIKWVDIDTVYDHYQTYKDVSNSASNWNYQGRRSNGSPINSGNLTAFCYDPSLEGATFDGDTTIYANGNRVGNGTTIQTNGTATVRFTHAITRNNNGPNGKLTNHYKVTGSGGGPGLSSTTKKFSKGESKTVHDTGTFTVNIDYGAKVTVCQTLHYDKEVTNDDKPKATTTTGNNCVSFTRAAGGNFKPKHDCSTNKGSGCDKEFKTNSQNWSISHQSYVWSNSGGTVFSGKNGTSNSTYSHSSLTYGTSATCQRSDRPYTHYWYSATNVPEVQGDTLSSTGRLDLPGNVSADLDGNTNNKYKTKHAWTETKTRTVCKDVGAGNGSYSDSNCNTAKSGGKYAKKSENYTVNHPAEYSYHYPGCEDGKTYWQTYNESRHSKTWNQSTENLPLILPTPAADRSRDTVSVTRSSNMKVVSNYSGGSWSGQELRTAFNTITRVRRYVNFSHNTSTIYADTGKGDKATTPHANGYTLDVSNADGYFVVTFGYSIARNNTENVYDAGAENFLVNNTWKSKETMVATDGSGTVYPSNDEKKVINVEHDYGTFPSTNQGTPNASGTKTQTVKGFLYYGQTIKICSNLNYGSIVRELQSGSEVFKQSGWKEAGCVTITRKKGSCTVNGKTYEFGHSGTTGNDVYNILSISAQNKDVPFMNYSTNWNPTTQSHTNNRIINNTSDIWARPGDNIHYKIDYCMGANYAHAVHLKENTPANDRGRDTTIKMAATTTSVTATDKQKTNYLFDNEVSTYNAADGKTTAKTFNLTIHSNIADSLKDSTNIGKKQSPGASSTMYGCSSEGVRANSNYVNTLTGNNLIAYNYKVAKSGMSVSSGFYQIHGSMLSSDVNNKRLNTGCNDRTSLDVGTVMSESVDWADVQYTNNSPYNSGSSYDYRSAAYVKVPYNYTAKPYIRTDHVKPDGTIQIGGDLKIYPGIVVYPRKNCAFVNGDRTACSNDNGSISNYATITKPTTVSYHFYVIDGTTGNSKDEKDEEIVVRANTKSNLFGTAGHQPATGNLSSGGTQIDGGYTMTVPNTAKPGDKACLKMTIKPADSHNNLRASMVDGDAVRRDSSNANDTYPWALTESGDTREEVTSCLTVVKRPTISTEDSNMYSAGNISTSIAGRNLSDGIKYYFGSWSEYGVFGKVITDASLKRGVSSGAYLGYNVNNNYHNAYTTGKKLSPVLVKKITYLGGEQDSHVERYHSIISSATNITEVTCKFDSSSKKYNCSSSIAGIAFPSYIETITHNGGTNSGSAKVSTSKVCNFSTQTFANVDCENNKAGFQRSIIGEATAKSFTEKILDKYEYSKETFDINKLSCSNNSNTPCITANGAKYANFTNIATTAAQVNDGDADQVMYKTASKNAFIGYVGDSSNAVDLSNTPVTQSVNEYGQTINLTVGSLIVYKADTVVINSSIIANNESRQNLSDIRMPIIIANRVYITGNPRQIDAIIIAKKELNTCKWNSYSDFINNKPIEFGIASSNANRGLNNNRCNNNLHFTAPVIVGGIEPGENANKAAKLVLNRTFGADSGSSQIQRAELFELNAATYLWSYAQMSRYSQATTTYSRELPSRY